MFIAGLRVPGKGASWSWSRVFAETRRQVTCTIYLATWAKAEQVLRPAPRPENRRLA